ncbi:MAG: hypothetical protein ACRC6K_01005, partial [Fusobacteriaceae bacterium]
MENKSNELVRIFESIRSGATIFGYVEAQEIREATMLHPECIRIFEIEELEKMGFQIYDNGKLAYFGAVLTEQGKEKIRE